MSEITRGVPEEVQAKAKIIDFAVAKARRLDSPVRFAKRIVSETPETQAKVLRPPIAGESNVIDFQAAREKRHSRFQSELTKQPVANNYEGTKPDISVEDEEQRALQEIRTKLAKLDVSSEKRDGIIEDLADDPKTSVKVAGVLRHITPPDVRRQVAIELEENAAFRKNLWDKLDEKQASLQEESKDGSLMELLLGLLKDFMTGKTDNQNTQDADAA